MSGHCISCHLNDHVHNKMLKIDYIRIYSINILLISAEMKPCYQRHLKHPSELMLLFTAREDVWWLRNFNSDSIVGLMLVDRLDISGGRFITFRR